MNYEQIKEQAKKHVGMQFTQKGFRYAFDLPMTGSLKLLNQLVKDGIVEKIGNQSFIVKAQNHVL